MTTNPRSREAAYADLVAGLIDARVDVASDRFDAELVNAEASGRLDPATARLLRWWQREAVRAVTEHAKTTIPASLVILERAADDARDAAHRADAAWTTARGVTARASAASNEASLGTAPTPPRPTTGSWTPRATQAAATPPPAAAPAPDVSTPGGATPSGATPSDPAPAAPEPPHLPGSLEPPGYPEALDRQPSPRGEQSSSSIDLTDAARSAPDPSVPAARRRTLMAGLTVLPPND